MSKNNFASSLMRFENVDLMRAVGVAGSAYYFTGSDVKTSALCAVATHLGKNVANSMMPRASESTLIGNVSVDNLASSAAVFGAISYLRPDMPMSLRGVIAGVSVMIDLMLEE